VIRVHVLGRVGVAGPQGAFDQRDLPGVQGAILLTFLVVERRPLARDHIADVLWQGHPPAGWASALNALLSRCRTLLTRAGLPRSTVLSSGGTIEAALPAGSWVDLEAAVRHLDRAAGAHRTGDVGTLLAEATAAWSIFRRPFLIGVDNPWADGIRRHNAERFAVAAELLAGGYGCRGDHRLAAMIAESAIAADPLRESAYRLAMAAHLAEGNRALALRIYERCAGVLRAELGVEPSPATAAVLGGTV
jgi:DNA-binding SARP family transcriptional activator